MLIPTLVLTFVHLVLGKMMKPTLVTHVLLMETVVNVTDQMKTNVPLVVVIIINNTLEIPTIISLVLTVFYYHVLLVNTQMLLKTTVNHVTKTVVLVLEVITMIVKLVVDPSTYTETFVFLHVQMDIMLTIMNVKLVMNLVVLVMDLVQTLVPLVIVSMLS